MRWLLCLSVVAACDALPSSIVTHQPQPFSATTDVWSGSEITITSAGFGSELPTVLLDGMAVIVRRADDSTMIVTLPDVPGDHALQVVAVGVLSTPVTVHLRGFLNQVEGPLISGRTEPALDPRYLFGSGPTSLRRWNLATNKAIDLGDTVHAVACTRGVGPGPALGQIVVLHGGCDTGRWTVWHTEPLYPLADTASVMTDFFVAGLGAGRWVTVRDPDVSVSACDAGSCTTESVAGLIGSDVVRSPRGDRAALLARVLGTAGTPGVPVVDVGTGTVGYRVSALRAAQGAAFSLSGDTLYLAGDSAATFSLVALRASDGAVLTSRRLAFAPCAVAVDPSHAWLYVAGVTTTGAVSRSWLQVFDRVTLQPIATLGVTSAVTYGLNRCRVQPNPRDYRVYVVDTWSGEHNPTAHGQLFSFETPH